MVEGKTISGVLFVYNEERYIGQMLNSILNQTVKVDHVIVIDDCSTDNTAIIIQEYQEKYPFIKYHLNDKKGKIYAYQKGLKLVDTDLFFVCAGDDVLMEDFTEKMYKFLEEQKIEFAYANYITVDEHLSTIQSNRKNQYYTCSELLTYNYVSGYLYGYSSILNHILPLPEGLLFEDWYSSIKLSSIYGRVYIYPDALFYYRRHNRASTASFNTKEKYFYYLDRDIKLFESLLREGFITDINIVRTIEARLLYLCTLRNYSFAKGIKHSLQRNLTIKERSKLILFPLYFGFKYK
jgi:glycosyltransferase involved in cell wall biosynthesis